jgi:hypothetical protein
MLLLNAIELCIECKPSNSSWLLQQQKKNKQ